MGEMRESNKEIAKRLQAVIDTAIDGIITIDVRGVIESINPAVATLFEYEPDEIIGQNVSMLMPEPYRHEHDDYIERYMTSKKPHIIGIGREVTGRTKSGRIFPFRLAVSEVNLGDRILFTGIIHDLSEVKKAQEEIRALNRRLEEKVEERTQELNDSVNQLLSTNARLKQEIQHREHAEQKLREHEYHLRQSLEKEKELSDLKSRFVSMASHEFRTPLSTILSSAALINRYREEDQHAHREKHVARIQSAVDNLTGILDDFLSLSKLEEGRVRVEAESFELPAFCSNVLDEMEGLLQADQRFIAALSSGTDVYQDPRILKNILYNIVSNAIKYSSASSEIHFDVSTTDQHFVLEVRDSGVGIPEADQAYLFTRFFRASNVGHIKGTGLGLHIVKRYVDLLGGKIELESALGQGTVIRITLPKKYEEQPGGETTKP